MNNTNNPNNIVIKRCIGLTRNGSKCRNKLMNDKEEELFCCNNHRPYNYDFIESGCFTCMEKIKDPNDMLLFKCNHIFHKNCYNEWLKYSTYELPICIICKKEVIKKQPRKKRKIEYENDNNYILKNVNILNKWI